MTQFYGLGQYYKKPPDYEKFPYANTTIIVNLHQYNRQAQFRGIPGLPELKAFNGWECAHHQWKERPAYRSKKERATDKEFHGQTGPMQYELTNQQADEIAQDIILQHLPTWLRRQYNIFIEVPVIDEYRVSEKLTAQQQYGRILQQLAHNRLGVVSQDGCMVGMRANNLKRNETQRIRIPIITVTNRYQIARKHIGGRCTWDHCHAACCGTGMRYAHG